MKKSYINKLYRWAQKGGSIHSADALALFHHIDRLETWGRPRACTRLDKAVEAVLYALPGREMIEAMDALRKAWEKHKSPTPARED